MNSPLTTLVVAIVAYVTEHGGYITKTKLLKLLYLFDVEFYRAHGRIFTGFEWKYFHLGPWTREFDPLLATLISDGDLTEHSSERSDFDTKFIRAGHPVDLRKPFETYSDEAILKSLLDIWGPTATGEILDYVYFRTEPMEHGVRNEKLDFSRIVQDVPGIYKRPASNKTASEIRKLRKEFSQKIAARVPAPAFQFTPPRYDEEFCAAMEKLDAGEL
jgi:hypothetical protein